jgi:hypothetical protein
VETDPKVEITRTKEVVVITKVDITREVVNSSNLGLLTKERELKLDLLISCLKNLALF